MLQDFVINCTGKLLDLNQPKVMGILNITPDSFYSGSRWNMENGLLHQCEKMIKEGAAILDIGAVSTRPGADLLQLEQEWDRLEPVLKAVKQHFPECIVSIDTFRAEIARRSVAEGAAIINDISAGRLDEEMFATITRLGVPYILMHSKGIPATMNTLTQYDDVVLEILDYFIEKTGQLRALGVKDIILDPGVGFAKNITQNFTILKKMQLFKILDLPLLAGISRKSMIYKTLGISPEDALNGTSALHLFVLQQGANILRVHDVKEAVEVIRLYRQLTM
jgi:dihydropteroate synthase